MPDNTFFDEQKYQSEVKSIIVYKFFDAWFNVLHNVVKNKPDKRLAYPGLFRLGPTKRPPAASNVLIHGTLSAHSEASHDFTLCPALFIRFLAVATG